MRRRRTRGSRNSNGVGRKKLCLTTYHNVVGYTIFTMSAIGIVCLSVCRGTIDRLMTDVRSKAPSSIANKVAAVIGNSYGAFIAARTKAFLLGTHAKSQIGAIARPRGGGSICCAIKIRPAFISFFTKRGSLDGRLMSCDTTTTKNIGRH